MRPKAFFISRLNSEFTHRIIQNQLGYEYLTESYKLLLNYFKRKIDLNNLSILYVSILENKIVRQPLTVCREDFTVKDGNHRMPIIELLHGNSIDVDFQIRIVDEPIPKILKLSHDKFKSTIGIK